MRIAMVTAFPEDPEQIASGPAGVGVTLSTALAAIPDVELEIIAPGSPLPDPYTRKVGSLTVHHLPRRRGTNPALAYLWSSPREIARTLSGIDRDLVHVQNWANFLPRSLEPSVLTIHGILEQDILHRGRARWLRSRVMRWVEMRARERAAHVILVSPYVREVLAGHLHGRLWEIDNPVADRFFEVDRRPARGRILFAGRMTPLKNVTGLIQAFALLAAEDPNAELHLAGGDDGTGYSVECERLASSLGVARRVEFLGAVGAERMKEEFSLASCVALCSFQENAPVVISEAMAAGVPVVASRVGGIGWMVEEGRTGWLVDPHDPPAIARALATALDPEQGERMSLRAREAAQNRFRASVVARKTHEVYREILR